MERGDLQQRRGDRAGQQPPGRRVRRVPRGQRQLGRRGGERADGWGRQQRHARPVLPLAAAGRVQAAQVPVPAPQAVPHVRQQLRGPRRDQAALPGLRPRHGLGQTLGRLPAPPPAAAAAPGRVPGGGGGAVRAGGRGGGGALGRGRPGPRAGA